jgi:hypothetical protein
LLLDDAGGARSSSMASRHSASSRPLRSSRSLLPSGCVAPRRARQSFFAAALSGGASVAGAFAAVAAAAAGATGGGASKPRPSWGLSALLLRPFAGPLGAALAGRVEAGGVEARAAGFAALFGLALPLADVGAPSASG